MPIMSKKRKRMERSKLNRQKLISSGTDSEGRYKNVILSDTELADLKEEKPEWLGHAQISTTLHYYAIAVFSVF